MRKHNELCAFESLFMWKGGPPGYIRVDKTSLKAFRQEEFCIVNYYKEWYNYSFSS